MVPRSLLWLEPTTYGIGNSLGDSTLASLARGPQVLIRSRVGRWGDFGPPRPLRPGASHLRWVKETFAALDLAEGLAGHRTVALRIAGEEAVGL
jgi:hypothetical protein